MLRERSVGESLWEAVLPAELRELPAELAKVDAVLDEDRFLAPFRSRLTATIGRPTIPVETYLRLMYLKHRYGLGYETLCKEVADSFTWRRFCRIALDGRDPAETAPRERVGDLLAQRLVTEPVAVLQVHQPQIRLDRDRRPANRRRQPRTKRRQEAILVEDRVNLRKLGRQLAKL